MNIRISNLNTQLKDEDLRNMFASYGEVQSAEIAMDAFTEKSRGFGFVEMEDEAAKAAIASLNRTEVNGVVISVEETEPRIVRKGSYKVGNGAVQAYRFRKN